MHMTYDPQNAGKCKHARQTGNGIEFGTAHTNWQGYRVRIRIRSSIVYKAIWKDWLLKWRQPHLLNAPPCDMYACMWLTVRCIEHWHGKPFTFSHRIHLYFHILIWIIWWNRGARSTRVCFFCRSEMVSIGKNRLLIRARDMSPCELHVQCLYIYICFCLVLIVK